MEFLKANIIVITLIIAFLFLLLYFIFKKDLEPEEKNLEEDEFSLTYLKEGIKRKVNEIVDQEIYVLHLNKRETQKREYQKNRLNKSVRNCTQGNIGERDYLKDYIKDLLQETFKVNDNTINCIIPFNQPQFLSAKDKFEILYHQFNIQNRFRAFLDINNLSNFDHEKVNEYGCHYEISDEDIHRAYDKLARPMRYVDKLEVITQRIYQEVYGLSIADLLRYDMTIDGISGGCSGSSTEQYNYMEEVIETVGSKRSKTFQSFWIFYKGKAIHLSFLSFASQSDLIRTCKNLYRHGSVGHLTSKTGYKLTYQADGSRVVVIRPNFATHWAFFLRKFDSVKNLTINKLFIDQGSEIVVEMTAWIVKGCLNALISGDQNSGKTTFLKAIAVYFDRRDPVRTTEQEFELWLNNVYEEMNCICLKRNEEMSIKDAISIQKKMDAAIMLLGEINTLELASGYISLCQSGTKSALGTIHTVTTEDLVDYMRNSLLAEGTLKTEMIAEEQVSNSVHIDIHWEKEANGHRYISYINEIIPYPREVNEEVDIPSLESMANSLRLISRKRAFSVRPLIEFKNGRYLLINKFSERSTARIIKNLSGEDQIKFHEFNHL